jgi:hypothetical protein
MKALLACLLLSSTALADVTTDFTLGSQRNNYITATVQDGLPTSGLWSVDYLFDCGLTLLCGYYSEQPQANIYLSLPSDPVNPGNRLGISCTGVVTLDTRPAYAAKTQQPPGVLESTETCPFDESWYSGTWTGTVTYNYLSVLQRHCSSGHPVCVSRYYPVLNGGSGSLTTADPPPMPPPPPPPVVSVVGSGQVDLSTGFVIALMTPNQSVYAVEFDLVNYLAAVLNTDGTTVFNVSLDYWANYPVGDDGDAFIYSIFGTVYNADGSVGGTYDCELTTDVNGLVSGGTFTEYPNQ